MMTAEALPGAARVLEVLAATWPPFGMQEHGAVTIRDGRGAGSRVSAATIAGDPVDADIAHAEAAMRALDQSPIFMIRPGEARLDTALAARGYAVKDPVTAYVAPIAQLADRRPPPVTTFEVWPPLAVQAEIWIAGGIGPARLGVMNRVTGPRTTILGRLNDSPAGTAFAACHADIAMLHALEVALPARRQGLAAHMLCAAAFWGQGQGAAFLSLVVTDANAAANALYLRLGMQAVSHYHYRFLPA